jgi:hypothetical protein
MLNNENTEKYLKAFRDYVVRESRANLTRLKKNSSKKLHKSIKGTIKVSKNSIGVDFSMEEYGLYQDRGVSGVKKKYNTPYSYTTKMPPTKALDKWTVRKGIAPRNKKGQLITRKSLKFLIARSIYINGIKPSLFFTKPFEKAYKRMPNELIQKYGLDLDKFIDFTLKDLPNGKNIRT